MVVGVKGLGDERWWGFVIVTIDVRIGLIGEVVGLGCKWHGG